MQWLSTARVFLSFSVRYQKMAWLCLTGTVLDWAMVRWHCNAGCPPRICVLTYSNQSIIMSKKSASASAKPDAEALLYSFIQKKNFY